MFTIDASVHINAENPAEAGSTDSQRFLLEIDQRTLMVYSPTLLLVEVAAAVSRALDDTERGMALAQSIRFLHSWVWIPLDNLLTEEACRVATEHSLRGADAVYAAVALRHGTTLVTLDKLQAKRMLDVLTVKTPAQILQELSG